MVFILRQLFVAHLIVETNIQSLALISPYQAFL